MIHHNKKRKFLGIIACAVKNKQPPFPERRYYEQLTIISQSLDISIVVFNPKHVDWSERRVFGYMYHPMQKKWITTWTAIPSVIYDRCFYVNSTHYFEYKSHVQKLVNDPHVKLLGAPLKGKWQLVQLVKNAPKLKSYLPPTSLYGEAKDVLDVIATHGAAVIKPIGGSHGRGIVAIRRLSHNGPFHISGRTITNTMLSQTCTSTDQLRAWLDRFTNNRRYIVQPFLHLHTPDKSPFDIRVLMQKDHHGLWQNTGMAVRVGTHGSLTSNLHGGGKAQKIKPFLSQLHFDSQTMETIKRDLQIICTELPRHIEQYHGRLCELGIDIGIDRQGRVWLLEVNSKPGRQVFRLAGDMKQYANAIKRPILYAHKLLHGS